MILPGVAHEVPLLTDMPTPETRRMYEEILPALILAKIDQSQARLRTEHLYGPDTPYVVALTPGVLCDLMRSPAVLPLYGGAGDPADAADFYAAAHNFRWQWITDGSAVPHAPAPDSGYGTLAIFGPAVAPPV